jgi:hypothetical protein
MCTDGTFWPDETTAGCAGPPCPDGGAGAGGTGGQAGTGGAAGGQAGTGGAAGGASGTGGGAPITSCPASGSAGQTIPCTGSFNCQLNQFCTCHGCCFAHFSCLNGEFAQRDYNDGCIQGPPCPDGGAGAGGSLGTGGADGRGGGSGAASVCTPGADQSCNDNPAVSSIHGHCTDAGVCVCNNDASTNPDSGRCP